MFTVCVNAPLWAPLPATLPPRIGFPPLQDNSLTWVSALYSYPAVKPNFSVYCAVCVRVGTVHLSTCITDTHTWADHQKEILCSNPCVYCHITKQTDFTLVRLQRDWPLNKTQRASVRASMRAHTYLKDHHGVFLSICCRNPSVVLCSAHFIVQSGWVLSCHLKHVVYIGETSQLALCLLPPPRSLPTSLYVLCFVSS